MNARPDKLRIKNVVQRPSQPTGVTKGSDGWYYFTASYPMYGSTDSEGYDRIILRRAKTIDGLACAEEKVIWDEKYSDTAHRFIWAPEIHKIEGRWYVLFAASGSLP